MNIVAVNEYAFPGIQVKNILIDRNRCVAFIDIHQLVIAVIMGDIVEISVFHTAYVCDSFRTAAFVYCFYTDRPLFLYFNIKNNKCPYVEKSFLSKTKNIMYNYGSGSHPGILQYIERGENEP